MFYIKNHHYTYTQSGFTINARCTGCDSQASVSIDTEYVYYQSRQYGTYDASKQTYVKKADYDLAVDNGWSDAPDILPYTVLYNGKHTVSSTETIAYNKVFEELKPTTTGNYTAQLAVLKNADDPDSALVLSEESPFYLADISIQDCSVLSYGSTQIAQFTEPSMKNGYYQVGTLSELLWCLYNKNADANISLTADIVVNPIRVGDDGSITSALYQIYTWQGFGTSDNPYSGKIQGNGHTIYGLYKKQKGNDSYSGFINYASTCYVSDLTIENSYIMDHVASGLIGCYKMSDTNSNKRITNCNTVNCMICGNTNSGSSAGGIVGYYIVVDSYCDLVIYNCSNDSVVKNAENAGGIIGCAEGNYYLETDSCINYGNITGRNAGGGIIGKISGSNIVAYIKSCINVGEIDSEVAAGGILGMLSQSNVTTTRRIWLPKNISQGTISDTADYPAGIIGFTNYAQTLDLEDNYYYGAGCGTNYNSQKDYFEGVTKLSKEDSKTYACTSRNCHVVSNHWSDVTLATCTTDGSMSHVCKLCGQVMDTQVLAAHGHVYEDGVCVYCDEAEPGTEEDEEEEDDAQEGTIVSSSSDSHTTPIVIGGIVAALVVGGGAYVAVRRKKNKE